MPEIIPAVLAKDFNQLKQQIGLVAGRSPLVHIDIEDGTLTRNASWPFRNGEDFEKIKHEEGGLPYWEDVNFEAHLMLADPVLAYEDWIRAGVERIIVHIESFGEVMNPENSEKVSTFLNNFKKDFGGETVARVEIGLAANFDTLSEYILPHVLECDFIQLMAIPVLGKQGETFQEGIFDKVEKIKSIHPDTILAVDGGVGMENAERLVAAGVERLVVGSAIFSADDPIYALEELISVVE